MFRTPRSLAPFAASLAYLFAACDTSEVDQDPDPVSTQQDASPAPSEAGASGVGEKPLDAGTADASSGTLPSNDAATDSGPRDAALPGHTDASTADAGTPAPSEAGVNDAGSSDPLSFASALQGLFVDVPCAPNTPTPLTMGATCQHPSGTQHIEKALSFGGDKGTIYNVKLRVRGIWEPTKIQGGERPDKAHPFTVGGMLPAGTGSSDAISYQQYSIQIAEPKQTYWLNDHQYLAHDIHKEDYQATLQIAGGARVTVIMNDGNDHEIANFTKDFFSDVPPYDKMPSLGQSLRLDVISVEARP